MNQKKHSLFKHSTIRLMAGLYMGFATGAAWPATDLDLADVPLYLEGIIEPNIVLTLDNSGSMAWAYMPDLLHHDFDRIEVDNRNRGRARPRGVAPLRNDMAYNPQVAYAPPSDGRGGQLPNMNFTAAWDDGYANYLGRSSCTVDLSSGYRVEWAGRWASLLDGGGPCDGDIDEVNVAGQTSYEWLYPPETPNSSSNPSLGTRAYYYLYYTNPALGSASLSGFDETKCDGVEVEVTEGGSKVENVSVAKEDDSGCYVRVEVDGSSGPDFRPDERQNFANWYSYYRNRIYTARAGLSIAFGTQGPALRIGYGALNNSTGSVDGVSNDTVVRGVRKFEDRAGTHTNRSDFFDWLFTQEPSFGGTPLRRAADDVGNYYERGYPSADDKGPWSSTPGLSGGTDFECRQSYHILTSDGYWNSEAASNSNARQNTEASDGSVYTNHSKPNVSWGYTASDPFKDSYSSTLADVAMYYWKRDLRPDLENRVPSSPVPPPDTSDGDPAFWQHVSTFTIGLGLAGVTSPTPEAAFEAIKSASKIDWPQPSSDSENNVYDMLHAAVNGRGEFFGADNPMEFAEALEGVLSTISERKSSSSSVALSSFSLFNGGRVYQATFNTGNWSGNLLAYDITEYKDGNGKTKILLTEAWQAAKKMPAPSSRRIFTADASTGNGIAFRWDSLGTTEKTLLDPDAVSNGTDSDLLRYIRGEEVGELRPREKAEGGLSPLGDVINSTPAFVGPPRLPYPDNWPAGSPENAGEKYSKFRIDNELRRSVIAAGGNDGMLHVFDEANGTELYAYIPSVLLEGLSDLSSPKYSHRYYVDGPPTTLDAFFGGKWHTMLVGGLNAGGQAVYAIDLTNVPSATLSEATIAADKLQWEFTDADDPDLGYTFSRPNIVRMANGEWAAVFGNGYNSTEADGNASTSGNAVLYIVRLSDGALIKKIDTQVGTAADPQGMNRPNGLSTVTPIDENGDFIVDYIYGGDLFGNLWRFDVNDSSTSQWKVGHGLGTPVPLFKARSSVGDATTAQSIYVRPQVVRHPGGEAGVFILFGTGKFFEVDDKNITDDPATPVVEPNTQTFYAIWDRFESPASQSLFTRNHLLEQEILREVTLSGGEFRETTNHGMFWYLGSGLPTNPATQGYLGWYMDLVNTQNGNTDNHGERVIFDALVFGRSILFTTMMPSDNPCDFGGSGWLMELSIEDGSRPPYPAFDVNGDGELSFDNDTTTGTDSGNFLSGTKSKSGIPNGVSIGRFGTGEHQKFYSDSTGGLNTEEGYDDLQRYFRQSWRRLQ